MFMYKGYYLEITPDKDVHNLLNGECPETKFFYIEESYDATIKAFKKYIDDYLLTKKEGDTLIS